MIATLNLSQITHYFRAHRMPRRTPTQELDSLVELIGITLVCYGVAQWSVAAAFVVGGVALVAEAAKLSGSV